MVVLSINLFKLIWTALKFCQNKKERMFVWHAHKKYGILLPKLFWHTVRKKCSSDGEKILKFEAEGREFAKLLRSLEQFIQTVKGQNKFW